mmetsp:Transcript_63733/g.149394  ORF Transcript_63733/g.149394 Transcript_63733/m.149394 type:complete len:233 (-) Transcript_63733:2-700(-)
MVGEELFEDPVDQADVAIGDVAMPTKLRLHDPEVTAEERQARPVSYGELEERGRANVRELALFRQFEDHRLLFWRKSSDVLSQAPDLRQRLLRPVDLERILRRSFQRFCEKLFSLSGNFVQGFQVLETHLHKLCQWFPVIEVHARSEVEQLGVPQFHDIILRYRPGHLDPIHWIVRWCLLFQRPFLLHEDIVLTKLLVDGLHRACPLLLVCDLSVHIYSSMVHRRHVHKTCL